MAGFGVLEAVVSAGYLDDPGGLKQAIENVQLDELSMGMSNDYRVAVQEGATLVRVGTAVFGDRP